MTTAGSLGVLRSWSLSFKCLCCCFSSLPVSSWCWVVAPCCAMLSLPSILSHAISPLLCHLLHASDPCAGPSALFWLFHTTPPQLHTSLLPGEGLGIGKTPAGSAAPWLQCVPDAVGPKWPWEPAATAGHHLAGEGMGNGCREVTLLGSRVPACWYRCGTQPRLLSTSSSQLVLR